MNATCGEKKKIKKKKILKKLKIKIKESNNRMFRDTPYSIEKNSSIIFNRSEIFYLGNKKKNEESNK